MATGKERSGNFLQCCVAITNINLEQKELNQILETPLEEILQKDQRRLQGRLREIDGNLKRLKRELAKRFVQLPNREKWDCASRVLHSVDRVFVEVRLDKLFMYFHYDNVVIYEGDPDRTLEEIQKRVNQYFEDAGERIFSMEFVAKRIPKFLIVKENQDIKESVARLLVHLVETYNKQYT